MPTPPNRTKPPIEEREGAVLLRLRVQPRASRNSIRVEADGRIRVTLTAPPVDDAANQALVAFIAGQLGVARRTVRVESGARSRDKVIAVTGISLQSVKTLIADFEIT